MGYGSAVVTAAITVSTYAYVIEGLYTGVSYYVAVSSFNAGQ